MPVAQTLVLRRVLTGGISTNSGRRFSRADRRPFGVVVLERCGEGTGGLVFGTLLGPEATGPWRGVPWGVPVVAVGLVFLVSWLHRGVCGVCGTGLLFENYIVDASIFYKKQFPRI